MNTNNVYFAKIYRISQTELFGYRPCDLSKKFMFSFVRDTVVYKRSNGKFYDLIGKRHLNCSYGFFDKVGTEFISVKHLVPFNVIVNQNKENLSKRKIKQLYIEHEK